MRTKKFKIVLIIAILLIIAFCAVFIYHFQHKSNPILKQAQTTLPISKPITNNKITNNQIKPNPYGLADPIADFKPRITKKPFGIYVTPTNSPIQPERFTGYHTGTDVEYQDVTQDVPVFAVANGTVTLARTASGYGGVMIINVKIAGIDRSVLYGHIRPSSLPKVGQTVTKGEQIGLLGTGYSAETDGERRHLHFAILSNNRLDLLGYEQTKSALSGWVDPLTFY
jgi:murein DD-endopeptidase MepM/ murein hydrolase activator NlpD